MTSIHCQIYWILRKERKYFVILQGARGSGKTYFANELANFKNEIADTILSDYKGESIEMPVLDLDKMNAKRFVVCSNDDYYNDTGDIYGRNLSVAYDYCKNKVKEIMEKKQHSIIYNNTNLDESQYKDIVYESIKMGYYPIILRFLPSYDEDTSVIIAKHYHRYLKETCSRQTIIRDNIVLLRFQNEFDNHKQDRKFMQLPIFGIRTHLKNNIYNDDFEKMNFKLHSPCLNDLKHKYIENGWIMKKVFKSPETPKLKPKCVSLPSIPQLDLNDKILEIPLIAPKIIFPKSQESANANLDELIENLGEQLIKFTLDDTIDNITKQSQYNHKTIRRQRMEEKDEICLDGIN